MNEERTGKCVRQLEQIRGHLVCNYINTTGVTSEAGTAYPSGAPESTPRFLVGFVLLDL
jgi:hypothetical protein